ncbi:hypothetical protein CRI94_15160 [Longibacter salinarum]|uniref:Delta-60 repeat domain-containing protein n=1 Tax=Longibacter salinarum TaxID=1850348 RepID=A0A2A8CUE4_9BACT|nr:delta-60 repeat domain-containing protein [Longibacter salinarum]PEN11376.1 hypothetical protein CRI94_15160 [Longibacter salinarum]
MTVSFLPSRVAAKACALLVPVWVLFLCTNAPSAHAQQRAILDPSFRGGAVTTDVAGGADVGYALALQKDGSAWVTGRAFEGQGGANLLLLRYREDGGLDPSFGSSGMSTVDLGRSEYGQSVLVQADGRIVVAGVFEGGGDELHNILVVRFRPNGELDPTFGTNGSVVIDLGGTDVAHAVFEHKTRGHTRLVVAGTRNEQIALVGLRANGRRDSTFGRNGVVTTDLPYRGHVGRTVVQQPDGRIVVAGAAGRSENGTFDLVLARYRVDGQLDRSFGRNGVVTTAVSGRVDLAQSAVVGPDGRIAVAVTVVGGVTSGAGPVVDTSPTTGGPREPGGFEIDDPGTYHAVVLRYLPDGRLDPAFGTNGTVRIAAEGSHVARGVVRSTDGSLYVVIGRDISAASPSSGRSASGRHELRVVRITPDGAVDPDFVSDTFTVQAMSGWRGTQAVAARDNTILVIGSAVGEHRGGEHRAPDVQLIRFAVIDRDWTILPTGLYVPIRLSENGPPRRIPAPVDFGQ